MVESKTRTRRRTPKTRTGCVTCKRRKVKCDERKPLCVVCERAQLRCDGYQVPKTWIFESKASRSTTWIGSDVRENSPDDSSSREHSETIELAQPDGRDEQLVNAKSSSGTPLYTYLISSDHEGPQLVQCYLEIQGRCPMAWDSEIYRPKADNSASIVDKQESLMLFSTTAPGPVSTIMTRRAHLVLVAAALRHFEPDKYPAQLYVRYQQMAVIEIRKRIFGQAFDIVDLLHGISKTFLAAVLHGADAAARAHLSAAQYLVAQRGGLDNIDAPTAAALRYGDFAYAVETLSPPVFSLAYDPPQYCPGDTSIVDPVLLCLGNEVCHAAEASSLPCTLAESIRRVTMGAIFLVHSWVSSYPERIDMNTLTWVASHIAITLRDLLKHQNSIHIPTSNTNISASHPQQLSYAQDPSWGIPMSSSTSFTLPPNQGDYVVTLVLWCQLMICSANECIVNVNMRELIPINNYDYPTSPIARSTLSKPVIHGLNIWNGLIREARTRTDDGYNRKEKDDWLQLFAVVEAMELSETVKVGPVMQRLLRLRAWRVYRTMDHDGS